MGRGYQDAADTYHDDENCPEMVADPIRLMPLSTAMKWDLDICENCVDGGTTE